MKSYSMVTDWKIQYCQFFSLKLIYKFNAITITVPESYFVDIDDLTLKFIWRGRTLEL